MPLLDALIAYLDAQSQGTAGEDIWDSRLPDGPGAKDRAAALIEYQGVGPEYVHGIDGPAYVNPRFQLMVRDLAYVDARTWAEAIHTVLAKVTNAVLSGTRYLAVTPMSDPFLLRRDEKDRPIIVCNYAVLKDPG